MKLAVLSPPDWSIYRNLHKWSRRLGIQLATSMQTIDSIIILGNGSPDDITYLILCHKLNGKKVVGITKTKEPRYSSIDVIIELAERIKVKKYLLVIDQENDDVNTIYREIERILRFRCAHFSINERSRRLRTYECTRGHRNFTVIIVVSGLDTLNLTRHTIEDHLLEFSKTILGENELNNLLKITKGDPKEVWKLIGDRHHEVFKEFLNTKVEVLKQIFPQHIEALNML